jgi:hypothetical protein
VASRLFCEYHSRQLERVGPPTSVRFAAFQIQIAPFKTSPFPMLNCALSPGAPRLQSIKSLELLNFEVCACLCFLLRSFCKLSYLLLGAMYFFKLTLINGLLWQDRAGLLSSGHFCYFPARNPRIVDCPVQHSPFLSLPLMIDCHVDTVAERPRTLWAVVFQVT